MESNWPRNTALLSAMFWLLTFALSVADIIGYHVWHKRAKTAARLDGSFIGTSGYPNFHWVTLCTMLLGLVFLPVSLGGNRMIILAFVLVGETIGLVAIIVCTSELWKKRKLSAKTNRSITIVLSIALSLGFIVLPMGSTISYFASLVPPRSPADTYQFMGRTYKIYRDRLPLVVEDFIETDYDGYSYEIRTLNQSVFAEYVEAVQKPRLDGLVEPHLEYSVTIIKAPFMYQLYKKVLLADIAHSYGRPVPEDDTWVEHIEIEAAPWGANEAYQLKLCGEMQMRFLLCYDNRIVEIDLDSDWNLTSEQMKTVAEKLGK